ncbi:hypothetical protein IT575_07895 [bacterium]|nr:hypothetical protein [bacterium]
MQQWEYLRVQVSVSEIRKIDDELAGLGSQGWELTAAVEAGSSYLHLFFKRPKS